jgi:hypothetical protein
MRLEEVEAGVFGRLVHWLYFQSIDSMDDNTLIPDNRVSSLAKLWTLAGLCLLPKFYNEVMRKIAVTAKDVMSGARFANFAYN